MVLQEGAATFLGALIRIGNSIVVAKYRRVPVETHSEALFQVRIGEAGVCRRVYGSTIPHSWQDAVDALRQSRGFAIVLGDVDTGKSTLCNYLANKCLEQGISMSFINGDIGQADVGPPTTTSFSIVSRQILSLQELKPERSYFIGDTSPSSVPDKLVQSLVRLKRELSNQSEITVLNTDGWVREDEAVEHKLNLIESLQPDLIFGLSLDHELDNILERQRCPTMRLEASSFVRARTREERKKAREEGYRRFLQNPKHLDFRLNTIRLRTFSKPRQERIDQGATHRGTLVGLLDENGILLSIGRIERIHDGIVRITTMAEERPRIIELGAVILSPRFGEVGFEP